MNKSKVIGICKLCHLSNKELQHGHVIASFYIKNEKDDGELYWRDMDVPNKREQDGVKEYLFCFDCEQLLSKIEKEFSEKIYVPLLNNEITNEVASELLQREFAIRFAICQSWRSLVYCMISEKFDINADRSSMHRTERLWRGFLLIGKRFSFKLYPSFYIADVNDIRQAMPSISSYINVYIETGAEFRLVSINNRWFILSKMNSVTIIGNINKTKLTNNQLFRLINDLAEQRRSGEEKISTT